MLPVKRPADQYAVHHPDGRWLYFLPAPANHPDSDLTGVFADGEPMTGLQLSHTHRYGTSWWVTDHQATQITATYRTSPVITGYTLRDPDTASAKYPATLTREQYDDRVMNDGHGDECDRLTSFYRRETAPGPDRTVTYKGPFPVLEGEEPPGADALPWKAELPVTLTERLEFRHLFPGRIENFQDHVKALLQRMPNVRYAYPSKSTMGLDVTIEAPFAEPVSVWQPKIGRNGRELKSGRNVPQLVTRQFTIPVPPWIPGDNYAQARARWDEAVAHFTGIVAAANVKACNTCGGKGHVGDVPDAPPPTQDTPAEDYPGELEMLRGLVKTLRAAGVSADGAQVQRLLTEFRRDESDALNSTT